LYRRHYYFRCSIGEGRLYIITAYRPSPDRWEAGGSKRKGGKQ